MHERDAKRPRPCRLANPALGAQWHPPWCQVPGKMYLRLYHGRADPAQGMDEWGFDGPTFGPLSSYVHTYCSTFRIHAECGTQEFWFERRDDMIQWDGCFNGDMQVFIAEADHKA